MVEIECLACGKTIKPRQLNDTENYDGQIVCQECKSLLYVKLEKGKVHKCKIMEKVKPEGKPVKSFVFKLPDGTRIRPGKLAQDEKKKAIPLMKKGTRSTKLKK